SAVRATMAADGPLDLHEVVRKGLAYVEAKSMTWLREKKCASCHHVPMMVWVQRDAQRHGFAIDETALKQASDFLLGPENHASIGPDPGAVARPGTPYSLMAVYTTLALREGGNEPLPAAQEAAAQEIVVKSATHLLSKQDSDGSWKRFEGRPPI